MVGSHIVLRAQFYNIDMNVVSPDRIIIEANKFLNVPFAHRGRSILGLDCLGLIIVSFYRCGVVIPSDDGFSYAPTWWIGKEERLHNHFLNNNFENVQDLQKGDIITFRLFGQIHPAHHCGFCISNDWIIHTRGSGNKRQRKTVIEMIGPPLKRRVGVYFRYKGYV